jgi:hypothetical protein
MGGHHDFTPWPQHPTGPTHTGVVSCSGIGTPTRRKTPRWCVEPGAAGRRRGRGERADLAAVYGPVFTGWAEALPHPPTLAGAAGAGSEAPSTKVVGNVTLPSPLGPGGGNALGYAWCSGRHNRTMSRLSRWSKAEGSNRANSNRNQNLTHGDLLPRTVACPL